jgi:hypothetical protein
VRLLTFLSPRFAWTSHSQTLPDGAADPGEVAEEVRDAVVVFLHAEARDEPAEARARALRHTAKHVKWLAGKRDYRTVVLHSFTHLGAENADPAFAKGFLDDLAARLAGAGYAVRQTPFGWFSAWSLDVHGESLAKVWKEV